MAKTVHGMSRSRLYHIWNSMKTRCINPKAISYKYYGEKGVKVCEEWRSDFIAFHDWAMSHGYQDDLTIDRIDNDGDYCPDNCRWSTVKEQSNNRSTNVNIKIGNATKTLTEWCEIFQLDPIKIHSRYKLHEFISIDDLFNP